MVWQDFALFFVSFLFSVALLPQVILGFRKKKKLVSLLTASLTFTGLYFTGIVYITLHLYFAAVMSLIAGSIWLTIFIQGIVFREVCKNQFFTKIDKPLRRNFAKKNYVFEFCKVLFRKKN